MTEKEKLRIEELRNKGQSYGAIASELGLSKNVVSSFCHRNKDSHCKNCGNKLTMTPKHKKKLFCSDKCRLSWWKRNASEMKGKVTICEYCKKEFTYYGNRKKRYCSRSCYLSAIRGGDHHE